MDEIIRDYKEVLFSCFSFEGRLTRKPFWTYIIITFIIQMLGFFIIFGVFGLPTVIFGGQNTGQGNFLVGLGLFAFMALFIFIETVIGFSTIGPQARRLRDGGFTPWLLLLHLCQFSIVVLILCCMESRD